MTRGRRLTAVAGLALMAASPGCHPRPGAPASVEVHVVDGGSRPRFRVAGAAVAMDVEGRVDEVRGRELLRVSRRGASVPVVGRYRLDQGALEFEPAVDLQPGIEYVAQAPGAEPLTWRLPRLPPSPPSVVDVAPHGSTIAANTLRIHVTFSEPMGGGPRLFDGIRLADAAGATIAGAFRETPRWSRDRRTLTLLLHPGRIKRDIPYARGLPPLLEPGAHVRLFVDGVLDAQGEALQPAFQRDFLVGPSDVRGPSLSTVSATPPRTGADPLRLAFDEPVDVGVAAVSISVQRVDPPGPPVPCTWSAGDGDRAMACAPEVPWAAGGYRVVLACTLEDAAGNPAGGVFDVRLATGAASDGPAGAAACGSRSIPFIMP